MHEADLKFNLNPTNSRIPRSPPLYCTLSSTSEIIWVPFLCVAISLSVLMGEQVLLSSGGVEYLPCPR